LIAHQDAGRLRHRLNNQDSRHDGAAGKVALEKGLIGAYILNADRGLSGHQFQDPINQKERIPVRQHAPDGFQI
jgi:hypothetical protein